LNLRAFSPSAGDAALLVAFECSTGVGFEDDVENWIRNDAVGWLNDMPKTVFQRRQLVLLEDAGAIAAISAWQDIVRVDLEGIWLEVLAVASAAQHRGRGQEAYDLVVNELHTVERDGDALAGLVHRDNDRSQRLLARNGWQVVAQWDDVHDLWVGSL
jgi:hypothetical protein